MTASGILITVDATSAGFDRAMASADRSLLRYSSQLKFAQKSQLEYDAAVAKFGATSDQAVAAQQRLGAALARTTVAEQRAAIESKRAAETQAADQAKIAAATERAAAAEVTAIDRAALASTRQAQAQARASLATSAALGREVAQFEAAEAAITAASAKAAAAAEAASVKQAAALRRVGTVAGTIGTLAAVGLGLAAKAASDFDAQMAKVATLSGAGAAQLQALSKAAGGFADIGISASEAADAEIELVKAGVSVKDIMGGGLAGALQLAAAGQLNVADASSIAAQAMTQFGLAGKDIPHIADLLSAGANKALGSVQDLGNALSYAGGPARTLGVSIEDTVATLAEFAQAGLIGEKGGAALQTMFARLVKPTAAASDELKKYNINLYDSQGQFVGMSALAGEFQKNMSGLSLETRNAALQTIFGNRAFRAAAILYQDGAKGAAEWARKVNDAGNASRTTAGQMDSLRGDVQKLGAAFQNDLIDAGQRLQPLLRTITQDLTTVGNVLGDLPGPVKDVGVNLTAIVAAAGLGVFAFTRLKLAGASLARTLGLVTVAEAATGDAAVAMSLKSTLAANKMALMRGGALAALAGLVTLQQHLDGHDTAKGFNDIAIGAAAGTAVLPGWGTAIGAAGGLAFAAAQQFGGATVAIDGLTATLDRNTGAVTRSSRAWALSTAVDLAPELDAVGLSTATFTQALLGNKPAMDAVNAAPRKFGLIGESLAKILGKSRSEADAFAKKLTDTAIALGQTKNAAVSAAEDVRHLGGTMLDFGVQSASVAADAGKAAKGSDDVGAAAARAERDVLGLTAAQRGLDQAFADSIGSVAALTLEIKSSADATKSLNGVMNKGKTAINAQSVAGATLIQNLTGIASAALAVTGGQKRQAEAVKTGRDAIVAQAHAAGASIPVANALADSLLRVGDNAKAIPPNASVKVTAPGLSTVDYQLQRVLQSINAFHDVSFNVNTNFTHSGVQVQYAEGGIHEGHVAQIPRAGMTRVWNEPEAGGEAYIPFAPQKRPRSRAIATETVARLGGDVRWHGDGGAYARMGPSPWRGGGSDSAIVSRLAAIEAVLTNGKQRATIDNGAEIGGQVRLTANRAVTSAQAQRNREALAGK